ncbi:glycosyl hydrolase [Nibricoccus sp. IMCC34717]|uniref:glycosyl hydrolase n=1 Tax=Nibricoccus sp. IMCC34717 TaxID=3034021 RepID=UPI00384C3131
MRQLLLAAGFLLSSALCCAADAPADLRQTFAAPPVAYRPLTWWHWVNGNVTVDGIDRDLAAMKDAGLGGFHLFDVSMAAPGPMRFGTKEWQAAREHALRRAKELGLQAGLQVCPGWATAGGPWVPVEKSMKRVVFTETWVEAGQSEVTLPQPKAVAGFYRDLGVFAVPASEREWADHGRKPTRITVVGHPEIDLNAAVDGSEETAARLPEPKPEAPVVVEIEYTQAFTPATLELVIPPVGWPFLPQAKLEALGADGQWQLLREFKVLGSQGTPPVTAVSLRPVQASRFRFVFAGSFDVVNPSALAEVRLLEAARVEDWAGHSLRTHAGPTVEPDALAVGTTTAIDPAQVVDLSHLVGGGEAGHAGQSMRGGADAEIRWKPVAGRWIVLRVGYTSTGKQNHPAQPEGTGYEVDKMDAGAVRDLLAHSLLPQLTLPDTAVSMALVDSWEAGSQNWTDALPQRFFERYGYDLHRWLPAFTGRPLGSIEDTRRFFWDFRRLVSREIADQFFGTFADELSKHGAKAYAEPYGAPFDNSEGGRHAHVPMAEFWLGDNDVWTVKDMSSVAHAEGRPVVAAESFTAGGDHAAYREAPVDFKVTGDRAFARGLNQVVLHSYVHQPYEDAKPGFSLGQFGSHFQRHESWWPLLKPWTDYLSRCHVLLREGRSVNDLAYARIDGSPTGPDIALYGEARPLAGLDFDFLGAVDLRAAVCRQGVLELPSGARYRVLVMPRSPTLSADLAERIADWVEAGLQVVGELPVAAPGLAGKADADARVRAAVARMQGKWHGRNALATAVAKAGLTPDFSHTDAGANVVYTHRTDPARDVYFVANSSTTQAFRTAVQFREGRDVAELWDPMTGEIRRVDARSTGGRGREVTLNLAPRHSCFVVFSDAPALEAPAVPREPVAQTLLRLDAGWTVEAMGNAPVRLEKLVSLTEAAEPALRVATGRACYRTAFQLGAADWKRIQNSITTGGGVRLRFGELRAVTRVTVNGAACGGTWLPPHELDIGRALRAGENNLEVEVSLPWANRLIADAVLDPGDAAHPEFGYKAIPDWVAQPPKAPDGVRRSFSSYRYYHGGEKPEPAGLLTPVEVVVVGASAAPAVSAHAVDEAAKALLATLPAEFLTPASDARPFVRWWWNGTRVDEKEIVRELDVMQSAGIGGVEINSIRMPEDASPEALAHGKLRPWLSEDWAKAVAFTADEAKKRGLTADLIIGSGWPFGGQFLTEAEQTQRVRAVKREVRGPATLELSLAEASALTPEERKRSGDEVPPTRTAWAFARLVAKEKFSGAFVAGTEVLPAAAQDTLQITVPAGEHVLYLGIREWGFTHVKMGAPGADGPVINHWDAPAVRRYLERMALALEPHFGGKLGTKLRALFVDSLELDHANWFDDLPQVFRKRFGYEIDPYLPFVLDEKNEAAGAFGATVQRARQDFCRLLIDEFEVRFLGTVVAFCEAHGVKARVQAYGRETHPIHGGLRVHLPEGETWLWHNNDNEVRIRVESTSANKLVSSAAHLRGQRRVSYEAMTNAVPVFRETPSDFKQGADLSFLDGLNHPILHGFNYTAPEAGFPGNVRYGCYFNERSPWWPVFPRFSDYIARVGTVLRSGESVAQVAVLLPLPDEMGRHGRLYQPFPELRDPWYGYDLGAAIHSTGRGADYVSERVLQATKTDEGRLVYGPQHYTTLVLPEVRSLELDSAKAIAAFVEGGGRLLIIGAVPDQEPGLSGGAKRDAEVRGLLAALVSRYPERVKSLNAPAKEAGRDGLVSWCADALGAVGAERAVDWTFSSAAVSQVRYRTPAGDVVFMANTGVDHEARGSVRFPFAAGGAWKLDPATGSVSPWRQNALRPAELTLAPQESLLLLFPPEGALAADAPAAAAWDEARALKLAGPWQVTLETANRGPVLERTLAQLVDLATAPDSELAAFGGVAVYRLQFDSPMAGPALLDLGAVGAAAEVSMNGIYLGTLWHGPARVETGPALRAGANQLEVRIYTSLANFMRNQKGNAPAHRWAFWFKPIPTGLLGPVSLTPKAGLAK